MARNITLKQPSPCELSSYLKFLKASERTHWKRGALSFERAKREYFVVAEEHKGSVWDLQIQAI